MRSFLHPFSAIGLSLIFLPGCSPDPDAVLKGEAGPGGGAETGADTGAKTDTEDTGRATPSVALTSPADGAMVENPVTFTIRASGVRSVQLFAEEYLLDAWDPAARAESTWSFSGTGYPRDIRLIGLDDQGQPVAEDALTITVQPPVSVEFLSPADGATVQNPVTFRLEGSGIDTLVLSADGWEMERWRPAVDGWEVSYAFSGTGYAREVQVDGLDSGGQIVATDTLTITPQPDPADGVSLDVPYFYQYDNRYEPGATCGITSTAMAINWWRANRVTPDALYLDYGKAQGQSPSGIAQIYQWEGLYADWTVTGTRAQIRAHLDAGRPVVAHGYWTGSGHVTAIVGYDGDDWIVNDPAGDWYNCYGCGTADHVRYPIGGSWDDELSVDGDIWFSVSDLQPF